MGEGPCGREGIDLVGHVRHKASFYHQYKNPKARGAGAFGLEFFE
jgi:hypothetical protein